MRSPSARGRGCRISCPIRRSATDGRIPAPRTRSTISRARASSTSDSGGRIWIPSTATRRHGRPLTPASLHRIRATLRSALNAAIREGLLRDNPARQVELPTPRRPSAQVWTKARVQAWQDRESDRRWRCGREHQLAEFLRFVDADRLYGDVVADRLTWAAPRRGRWAALGRRRSRRPDGDDQPAAPRLRPARSRSVRRRPPPAAAPSPWTGSPSPCCAGTGAVRRTSESPPARSGTTPGTCSPPPTGSRCTRTT